MPKPLPILEAPLCDVTPIDVRAPFLDVLALEHEVSNGGF